VMDRGRLVEQGPPQALCDAPQQAFTARFLGARTVIEGASRAGVFEAPGLACAGAPVEAKAIVLRAARLRLADPPENPLRLDGVLAAAAYLGDAYELDVDTPAGRVRVLAPSETRPPAVGASCRIAALPGAVSFIS
jgi:putative spermidine/putrescine transport system ATP-binding protein